MKKIIISLSLLMMGICIFACSGNSSRKMKLEGVEYDAKFVESGYYFDKASISDAKLADMLSKVKVIKKPENLGTVELPDFSTIELTKIAEKEVTDADIEAEIEKERDKDTTYEPITTKRAANFKDKVTIDFVGYVDGELLEGGTGLDFELVLGSGSFIPGFEEKIVGHSVNKKFSIDVVFPENYAPELSSKPARFDITIKAIAEPKTPEVDEAFIKKHTTSGSKTADEFVNEIKQRIIDRQKFQSNSDIIYQLSEKLYMDSKYNPTEEALAWQFSVMISQIAKTAKDEGIDLATMLEEEVGSVKDAYDEIKSYVPDAIHQEMILAELEKRFKVVLKKDDVKKWFETMSEANGYGNQISFDDYASYIGYDNLMKTAKQEKILLEAVKLCKVKEVKEGEE